VNFGLECDGDKVHLSDEAKKKLFRQSVKYYYFFFNFKNDCGVFTDDQTERKNKEKERFA
jgi:hypothetical protein